jgi:probable F420-dependent oxidoreductase
VPRGFRFSTSMPTLNRPIPVWRDEVRRIEDLGFNSVSVSDHFTGGWAMDPIVAMTVAAEATTSLRVQCAVFCNDFRHPVMLHKSMANLDVFSGGRVEIGLGAGWMRADHDAAGLAFDEAMTRIERLDEAMTVLKGLFAGSPFTFQGEHYRIDNLAGLPAPAQRPHPPLLVGGGSRRILELAGRQADIVGINPRLASDVDAGQAILDMSPERVRRKVDWARHAAIAAGRNPDDLEFQVRISDLRLIDGGTEHRSTSSLAEQAASAELTDSPAVLAGTVDECVDRLVKVREEYGISYFHLGGSVDAAGPIVARLAGE